MTEVVQQLSSSATQGILAGVIFLLGAIVVALAPRLKWLAAGSLLVMITPIALAGFWTSTIQLGISDWDYYFSLHENLRRTVLEFHQFPLWNPWTCGGTASLADPEFPLFTLTFPFELIFGIPTGLRLAIYVSVATTALGMLILAKRLKLSVHAALLTAIGVAFGSVNLLEIVEGHPNILAVMWIPWIFLSWHSAYQKNAQPTEHSSKQKLKVQNIFNRLIPTKEILLCGLFLAMTFFQGGIYLLFYSALAFLAFIFLARDHRIALTTSLQAGMWAMGLAAIKLIPVALWLQQFQDTQYASSTYTLLYLHEILLGRHLHGAGEIIPQQESGWHEYGAYVGPVLLLLAAISFFAAPKKRIVRILITSALLALLLSSSGPFLKPLFDQISFIPRSNISRVVLFAVIPLSLLAGFGLDTTQKFLERRVAAWKGFRPEEHQAHSATAAAGPEWRHADRTRSFAKAIAVLMLGLAAIDLMSFSYQLSEQAFVIPQVIPPVPPAPYPIAYTAHTYKYRHTNSEDYTRAYAATLAGYGTLSYCSVLTPPPLVRTIHDEVDIDIIATSKEATYKLISWSPNTARVTVTTPQTTSVTLNTNYAKGWYANDRPAINDNGRVSTSIPPGTHEITFRYKTPGMATGLTITLSTIALALYILASAAPQRDVPPQTS